MPRPPSTRMRWPSLILEVAMPVPTTAGRPYSRATMPAWLIEPPMSDTAAEIFWKIGAQVGLVTWQTRMSPCFSRPISSTDFTTLAMPSTTPREAAIIDLMTSWSNDSPPRGPSYWPPIVAERRAAIAEWAKHDTPPALGPVPDVIEDPAIVMLWGITRENLDIWMSAGEEGDPNEIKGVAASNGVVEGTARVVKSVEEIGRLKQGDILVCQVTNPTWAPIFQKISAAVSDIGGSMSHAAIVAREYGLPAVVGTGMATSRIKDGQRIRVDGGRGTVTILE